MKKYPSRYIRGGIIILWCFTCFWSQETPINEQKEMSLQNKIKKYCRGVPDWYRNTEKEKFLDICWGYPKRKWIIQKTGYEQIILEKYGESFNQYKKTNNEYDKENIQCSTQNNNNKYIVSYLPWINNKSEYRNRGVQTYGKRENIENKWYKSDKECFGYKDWL